MPRAVRLDFISLPVCFFVFILGHRPVMWRVALLLFSFVSAQVTSEEIKVTCHEHDELPNSDDFSPSQLGGLNVKVLTDGNNYILNISWAINIDASIRYLQGTRLVIDGEPPYLCEYSPNLAEAELTGTKQKWFHYEVPTGYGEILVQVSNLPLPPLRSPPSSKYFSISLPRLERRDAPRPTLWSTGKVNEDVTIAVPTISRKTALRTEHVTFAILGGLSGLLILSSCYIIYKNCASIAKFSAFKRFPTSQMVPIRVLMVYAAENSAFQQAVVALAEFLQWHGGCSIAVDMWQQGKIAELGPMRWLVEQIKTAERVLIVCPQHLPQANHTPSEPSSSIPAAAHDLYPLILNIVASHAKNSSELAKFWVVQLGEQQDTRTSHVALELRACKTFCLMKNLNKLCRNLHIQRQSKTNVSNLLFRPGIFYNEKSTAKLREAVKKLIGHQLSISIERQPLKFAVMSV